MSVDPRGTRHSSISVPAEEWRSHSPSGTSPCLLSSGSEFLLYSGTQWGRWRLSNALWPAPLPPRRFMTWTGELPLGWGRRRRARSLPKPRACGTCLRRRCRTPVFQGRASRAAPRRAPADGSGTPLGGGSDREVLCSGELCLPRASEARP